MRDIIKNLKFAKQSFEAIPEDWQNNICYKTSIRAAITIGLSEAERLYQNQKDSDRIEKQKRWPDLCQKEVKVK